MNPLCGKQRHLKMEKCKGCFLTNSNYTEEKYFLPKEQVSLTPLFFRFDLKQELQWVISMELKGKKVTHGPGLKKKKQVFETCLLTHSL